MKTSEKAGELLNLPRISRIERSKQVLSMDEFDRFNQDDAGICFDRDTYLKEKRRREVREMFVLQF